MKKVNSQELREMVKDLKDGEIIQVVFEPERDDTEEEAENAGKE